MWQMVALPDAGAMADQDAWTMAALGFVRDVMNNLEIDLWKAATKKPHEGKPTSEPETVHGE